MRNDMPRLTPKSIYKDLSGSEISRRIVVVQGLVEQGVVAHGVGHAVHGSRVIEDALSSEVRRGTMSKKTKHAFELIGR